MDETQLRLDRNAAAGMLREVITPMATATIATKTNANAATPTRVRDVRSSQ